MGGGDTKTVNTSQSSETNPWAPTIPMLSNIISSLGGINTGVTGGQSSALSNLQSEAGSIPNLAPGVTGAVTGALGTDTGSQQGMLGDAYKQYISNIGGTASGADLDPYKTPGFSDAIGTMTNDITKQIASTYAGSGREPSGAGSFAGSLGRGITQGVAPVIQSQFNTNKNNQMNAAGNLFNAGGSTASGLTQQQLAQLQAQFQGVAGAGALPGILTAPGQAQLGAANAAYQQPISNISALTGAVAPIAALGAQSSGTGTQQTEQSKSLLSNIIGGASGLAGLNGALGSGWLSSLGSSIGPAMLAFSDERVKEDIEPVGETHDGQTLYSYRYIGDPEPRVGLLAQEVEQRDPGAVVEIGGIKAVNYPRALKGSREIGMLKMAA